MRNKNIMQGVFLTVFKFILNAIYIPFKFFKTKNKVVFMSRQFDFPNLDFVLLSEKMREKDREVKIVFLCKKIRKGLLNKVSYIGFILSSMYHLVTSKICIIDTYIIQVSILKHKKKLKIIQIWHALRGY
jgi:CDP-ribitol ribitolphosphotransferase